MSLLWIILKKPNGRNMSMGVPPSEDSTSYISAAFQAAQNIFLVGLDRLRDMLNV